MTNKYFTAEFTPDIVMGDISDVYTGGDGVNLAAHDLVADWTAIDVPKGTCALHSVLLTVNNVDGGADEPESDWILLFAKEANGIAPPSIKGNGFGYAPVITNGGIREHLIGGLRLEASSTHTSQITSVEEFTGFTMYQFGAGSIRDNLGSTANGTQPFPIIIDLEPTSGTNVGYDKLYVAVLIAIGTPSFETNVLANYASGAPADDSTTTIVVDTVDPRLVFGIGDSVYNGTQNNDTAIGVVKSLGANSIELESNNVGAIVNNDELINGNPIRIRLGLEK